MKIHPRLGMIFVISFYFSKIFERRILLEYRIFLFGGI